MPIQSRHSILYISWLTVPRGFRLNLSLTTSGGADLCMHVPAKKHVEWGPDNTWRLHYWRPFGNVAVSTPLKASLQARC
jgi:hypothetical protein